MAWIGKSYNPCATPKGGYFVSLWGFMVLIGIVEFVIMTPALSLFLETKQVAYANMLFQGFFIFALSALLVETYYRRSHSEIVWRLSTRDYVPRNTLPMLLLFVVTLVSSGILSWAMELLPVPALFQTMERITTEQYEQMIAEREPISRALIWLGTVVAAPFGEELFFRGGLLGWLLTRVKDKHAAIWLVALIFSAVHMQWTGFPARLLIGGILGYVAIYGGLWMAILFHLLNNLLALALPEVEDWSGTWWLVIVALPAMILLTNYMKTVATQKWATTDKEDLI